MTESIWDKSGASEAHKIWHKFCDHMKKWYYKEEYGWSILDDEDFVQDDKTHKVFDSSKMIGYKCMQRCEKYAKKNKEIKIISVDDSVYSGSILILVPHPKHGVTIIFVTQHTDVVGNQFFLHHGEAYNLISKLHKMNYEVDGRL